MNFMVCELYFNKTVTAKLKTGKQNKRLKKFGGKTGKKKKCPPNPSPQKKQTHRKEFRKIKAIGVSVQEMSPA